MFSEKFVTRIFLTLFFTFIVMRIIYHLIERNPLIISIKTSKNEYLTRLTKELNSSPKISESHLYNDNHTMFKNESIFFYNKHLLPNKDKRSSNKTLLYKKMKKHTGYSYNEHENLVSKTSVTWEKFLTLPSQPLRTFTSIHSKTRNQLKICDFNFLNDTPKQCQDPLNANFIETWKNRLVNGLCETNANSKINCFDSTNHPTLRFCTFENAMMDFRKVHKRKHDGKVSRSWERGFLSADCGDMAPDDIGYSQLYKPDIEGRELAMCKYVFNETVLVYSHDNIRNFGSFVNDYLNVWSMLWLSGYSKFSKDITFLNIDSMRKGKYFGDQMNQYFKSYNASFRRVLKASDAFEPNAKVCFKKLIFQPKPSISYLSDDRSVVNTECSTFSGINSLVQRFNIQIRQNYGFLEENEYLSTVKILLIKRTLKPEKSSDYWRSRIIQNEDEIVENIKNILSSYANINFQLHVEDLFNMTFDNQVKSISTSNLIIGMHSVSLSSIIHMPIGKKFCCGVIELFPSKEFPHAKGYGHLARKLGLHYSRLDFIDEKYNNHSLGSIIPVDQLSQSIKSTVSQLLTKETCIHPDALNPLYI